MSRTTATTQLLFGALIGAAVSWLISRETQSSERKPKGNPNAKQPKEGKPKEGKPKEGKPKTSNKGSSRQQRLSPELSAQTHFVRPRLPEGDGPSRTILCHDVKEWLEQQKTFPEGKMGPNCSQQICIFNTLYLIPGMSVIASFPDISELFEKISVIEYKIWFEHIAASILQKLRPGQCAVFYQSDIRSSRMVGRDKRCEELVHKVGLVANASLRVPGTKLWWHKIVSYAPLDSKQVRRSPHLSDHSFAINLQVMGVGRPQLSHIVCYGKNGPPESGCAAGDPPPMAGDPMGTYDARSSLSPDIMWRGVQLWERGMGIQAAHMIADFLRAKDQPVTGGPVTASTSTGASV